jgi:hypothetical protein
MSKIPPIPPQIGNIVGFDFVGEFYCKENTRGVLVSEYSISIIGK